MAPTTKTDRPAPAADATAKTATKKRRHASVRRLLGAGALGKLLRQIAPDAQITASARDAIERLSNETLARIVDSAVALTHKRKTVTAAHVSRAARLLFTGELTKHAVAEITKHVLHVDLILHPERKSAVDATLRPASKKAAPAPAEGAAPAPAKAAKKKAVAAAAGAAKE